jgi:hypothetical protein
LSSVFGKPEFDERRIVGFAAFSTIVPPVAAGLVVVEVLEVVVFVVVFLSIVSSIGVLVVVDAHASGFNSGFNSRRREWTGSL